MLSRWSLGLLLSLLAHLGVVAIGLAVGARGFTGPVEIEIAGVNIEEVKDLPLGGPQTGAGKARAPARARGRAAQPPADGTRAERRGKDEKTTGSTPTDDDAGPAPTNDLGAYAPQGSRLTMLMRLDRLRGTDYAAPDPLDASVTFLAVRHHLDDAKVRAALTRGARASETTLTWRMQGGRPIAERHPLDARRRWRDDRLIMLATPGLTVVTPPAYRALLLAPAAPVDGGVADGAGPDGGVPGARSAAASASKGGWATLLTRIDAEEGLMPPDGAVMVNAVDMFKARASSPGEAPQLYGMPIP